MKLNAILSLTACCLAFAGCSSSRTKVDSGTIHAGSFSFVNRGVEQTPAFANNRQHVHSMIQDAVTKNLAARGVTRKDTGGEVTVGYLIITGNNVSTTAINDYFGYSSDSEGLHDKAFKAYTKNKNPDYFEAGTLVIDLIDPKSFKLLRRNYATRPLLKNATDDARASQIQGVVDEIFRSLKVAR